MLFSVLIPVYNVEKYLIECIESVLSQSETDYEIILCDDGSTDNSGKICDEYREKYPDKIRVIHKANEGLLLTRRVAIKASKGDWIVHLDSDDYMLPDHLLTVKNAIDNNNNLDMVIFKVVFGKKDLTDFSHQTILPFYDGQIFEGEDRIILQKRLILGNYFNQMYMKVCKRNIIDIDFDYYQFPKIYKAEDKLQSLPLLDNFTKAIFVDKPLIYYRLNENSISHAKNLDKLLKQIDSHSFILTQSYYYAHKWNFTKNELSLMDTVHLRCLLGFVKRAFKNSNYNEFKKLLHELSIRKIFYECYKNRDKNKVGHFSDIFYFLLFKKNFFILYLFLKIFVK